MSLLDQGIVPVTDAQGWPATVKVTLDMDYTSDDGDTTTKGRADFTFERIHLADLVTCPKLLFSLSDCQSLTVPKGKFLPVQLALGRMPGWIVLFGAQDAIADAFTTTVTSGGSSNVTTSGADCYSLQMTCAPCAPGRYTAGQPILAGSYFPGLVAGLVPGDEDDEVEGAAYTVEQVYAGFAGDDKTPAIPPVYRVTLPDDLVFMDTLSIVYNGQSLDLSYEPGSAFGNDLLGGMLAIGGVFNDGVVFAAAVESRSATMAEVQLAHFGDTLAAGTVSYWRGSPADSSVTVNGQTITLDDPFGLTGQSVDTDRDANGLQITVAFS